MPKKIVLNAESLLHFNGNDAATTTSDDGLGGYTWISENPAQLDTAQKEFGSASALFTGTGSFKSNNGFVFGTSDFTIDMWVRIAETGNYYQAIFGDWNSRTFLEISTPANNYWAFNWQSPDETLTYSKILSSPVGLNTGVFYHLAIVRYGETINIYQDGVLKKSAAILTGIKDMAIPRVGNMDGSIFGLHGWVDEFRFVKIAKWYENFTPPTSEYNATTRSFIPSVVIT